MKCITMIVVMMLVMVSLAGCGGAGAAATVEAPGDAGNSAGTALDTSYEGALPVMNQLALGSMLLDDTGQALGAEQASTLLPLWQGVRSTLNSSTSAQAEIDALLKQIEKSMTPEQLAAIRDMQLTQADLVEYVRSNNLARGGGQFAPGSGAGPAGGLISPELRATLQAGGELPPELQATLEARRAQGGFVPGGAPGEGGAFSPELRATIQAGGDIPPEIRATIEARGGPPIFGGNRSAGASLLLVNNVIDLLEARANP